MVDYNNLSSIIYIVFIIHYYNTLLNITFDYQRVYEIRM